MHRIGRVILTITREGVRLFIKFIQAAAPRANPENIRIVLVFNQFIDEVAADGARIVGVERVMRERAGFQIKLIQAAAHGADPDAALPVLHDAERKIVGDALRILVVMLIARDRIRPLVNAIQATAHRRREQRAVLRRKERVRRLRDFVMAEAVRIVWIVAIIGKGVRPLVIAIHAAALRAEP